MSEINEKRDLYEQILAIIRKNRKTNLMADLSLYLKDRVSAKKITLLFNENHLELSNKEIYWLAKGILNILPNFNFVSDLKSYFTNIEISEAEMMVITQANPSNESNKIVIEDVIKLADDKFECVRMTYAKIAEFLDSGKCVYNYETQREATLIDTGIGYAKMPTISPETVRSMKEKMKARKFYDNTITWNILKTGDEIFDYVPDQETKLDWWGKLIVVNGAIDIIDGYKRTLAIKEALIEEPSIANEIMQVKIYNYDVVDALGYIHQEQLGEPFTEERKVSLNQYNINKAIDVLNTKGNSSLLDKITMIEDEITKYHSACVYRSTMYECLDYYFGDDLKKSKLTSQFNRMSSFLIQRFNLILDYFEKDFKDMKTSRENKRIYTLNNMFYVYAPLIAKFKDDEEWEEKTIMFLDYIDKKPETLIKISKLTRKGVKLRDALNKEFEEIFKKVFSNDNKEVV